MNGGAGRHVLSVAALSFAVLLAIGVSIPANAFGGPDTASPSANAADHGATQDLSVDGGSASATGSDAFSVTAPKPKIVTTTGSGIGEPRVAGIIETGAPGPLRWPTDISPRVGKGVSEAHHGQDLLVAGGTPVHAIADGTVLTSTTEGSLGEYVAIQSTVGGHVITSLYAHLASSVVTTGAVVTQGQEIGTVGSSGAATADLLYLRILQDGELCDTVPYIAGDPAGGAAPH